MIQGNFYFKLTERGNLIGEFTNNGMEKRWDIESANYHSGTKGNFVCIYISTWLEEEKAFTSKLTITNDEEKKGFYKLDWIRNGKKIFCGDGFVIDNILYGDYRSYE